MSGADHKKLAFRGVAWSMLERLSSQLALFIATIVIARIVTPEAFGLVGMLLIFIEVGEALASSGFLSALVRRGFKNPDDGPSAWWCNIFLGWGIYAILWWSAPWIADFYETPQLESLVRAMALIVPLRSMAVVSSARLTAAVDFRAQTISSLTAILLSAVIGIYLGYRGYSVWALVSFQVSQYFFLLITLSLAALPLRNKGGHFNFEVVKDLFRFGRNLTGARLADVAYNNSYLIGLGLIRNASIVGFFTRGRQLATVPAISCNEIVRRVAYPILCRVTDRDDIAICNDAPSEKNVANNNRLSDIFRRMMRATMFIAIPIMLLLAALSNQVVGVLLGEKWMAAAPVMTILCLGALWVPVDGLNLTLLTAIGRPAILLRLEIARKVIGLTVLLLTLNFGLSAICIGYTLSATVNMLLTAAVCGKRIGYGIRRQLTDLIILLLTGCVAATAAYSIASLLSHQFIALCSGAIAGAAIYFGLCTLFRISTPMRIIRDFMAGSKLPQS